MRKDWSLTELSRKTINSPNVIFCAWFVQRVSLRRENIPFIKLSVLPGPQIHSVFLIWPDRMWLVQHFETMCNSEPPSGAKIKIQNVRDGSGGGVCTSETVNELQTKNTQYYLSRPRQSWMYTLCLQPFAAALKTLNTREILAREGEVAQFTLGVVYLDFCFVFFCFVFSWWELCERKNNVVL